MTNRPDPDRATPPVVVINLPGIEIAPVAEALRARDGTVEVVVTDYDITHPVRADIAAAPLDPAVRERIPALSDAQRESFSRATVILGLDLPLDLRQVSPALRWVHVIGSGTDLCVPAGLVGTDVLVTNSAGVAAGSISEFVLARLFEHWKRLPQLAAAQAERTWQFDFGRRVAGRTLGIIGLGAIGAELAVRARALGMHVIATRRSHRPGDTDPRVDEIHGSDALLEVVARADAVVVCATGTPENEDLISAAVFEAMRDDALFVNVARGNLVDEDALVHALTTGQIAGAALDVTRTEPLPADSALWAAPNLRLSPHSSVTMDGYFEAVFALFLSNLERFLGGQPLHNTVDLAARYPG